MPFYRYTIHTPLTPEAVRERIREHIVEVHPGMHPQPPHFCTIDQPYPPFRGRVEGNSFFLNPIPTTQQERHSSFPLTRGTIRRLRNGSQVAVTNMYHPFVMVFLAIWFFFVGRATIRAFAAHDSGFDLMLPLLMLVGVFALLIGNFCATTIKARRFLEEILTAPQRQLPR